MGLLEALIRHSIYFVIKAFNCDENLFCFQALPQTSERGGRIQPVLPNVVNHRVTWHHFTHYRSSDGLGRLGPVLTHDGQHAQVHELGPLDDVLEGGHEVGGEGLVDEPAIQEMSDSCSNEKYCITVR